MKKILLITFALTIAFSISAQVPQLPEILQEKLDMEQLDLTVSYDETEQENTEEQYYRYIPREEGNDTLLGYRWNPYDEVWMLRARIIKVYNDEEQVTDKWFQIYTMDDTWNEGLYFSYTYNGDGKLSEALIQHWQEDAADWVNHYRRTISYDDDGHLSNILNQWWSKFQEAWKDHQIKIFTWTDDLLVADTVKIRWHMNDGWENFLYNEFAYTDTGLRDTKTLFFWWHVDETWYKNTRFNYTYDDSGENIISVVSQKWFADAEEWKDKHRYNYTYNDDGDITTYLFEVWGSYDNIWFEKVKIDYSYNDQGWMSQFVWQCKPFDADDWENRKQAFFSYDDMGNMIERIDQKWNHYEEDWMNFSKWEMVLQYYMITNLVETDAEKVNAHFRNPYQSGDMISFNGLGQETYTLQLYDMTGQLVEQLELSNASQTAFRNELHNGLYIMVLTDQNEVVFKSKMVVAR